MGILVACALHLVAGSGRLAALYRDLCTRVGNSTSQPLSHLMIVSARRGVARGAGLRPVAGGARRGAVRRWPTTQHRIRMAATVRLALQRDKVRREAPRRTSTVWSS